MKHLSHLILASAALAATLAACGGAGDSPDHGPAGLPPQLLAQSHAVPTSLPGLRWDPTYDLPDAPKLKLVIKDGEARVCQRATGYLLCGAVDAPIPNATIDDWSEEGSIVLGYSPAGGSDSIDDAAVMAFQAAVNGAARAVMNYAAAHSKTGQPQSRAGGDDVPCVADRQAQIGCDGSPIDDPNGGHDIPQIPVPGTPEPRDPAPTQPDWGPEFPWPDHTPTGPQPDPAPMQVVVVHGTPEPVQLKIPATRGGGLWAVPTYDQLVRMASGPDQKCIDAGIVKVCIWGKRPPLVNPDDVELRGRTPWFPQGMCNWAIVFCSADQVPQEDQRDWDRLPGSEVCGKTMEELYRICERQQDADIGECDFWRPFVDGRIYSACRERASHRRAMCQRTASTLTGNGRYPAKCD